jgi:pyridoxine 5-phosphate synthase
MACADEVVKIACDARPDQATLVPESREEETTEGGLEVISQRGKVADVVRRLHDAGIVVSLFLDADERQIDAAREAGADAVELHTGQYALAASGKPQQRELDKLTSGAARIVERGMTLHAGHGLTYRNVVPVAHIAHMCELNIGHSIIARALMVGFQQAVREMKELVTT